MNETKRPAVAGPVEPTVRLHGDGGPAFPDPQEDWRGEKGMGLRDYFAAHASDADVEALRDSVPRCTMVVDDGGFGNKRVMHNALPTNWRQIARYLHADRMLAVRAA